MRTTRAEGVVAAGHRLTAKAAGEILRDGGNAFDAAIAAIAMATVAEPALASLGGGGFCMAVRPGASPMLYDFFVETPRRRRQNDLAETKTIHADFGAARQSFRIGHGTTATPGMVPGVFALHRERGSLPLACLFAPAIAAAQAGVIVNRFQAKLFAVIAPILMASENARALFAPRGRPLQEGDRMRMPVLAETLQRLAAEGEALFRTGAMARAILEGQRSAGHLTQSDLAEYRVVKREPLIFSYRGAQIVLNPPPAASGVLIAFALQRLAERSGRPQAIDIYHALCAANRAREEGLDETKLEAMRGDGLAETFTALKGHPPAYRGTTHLSVIDAAGNAASVSLSNGEGSGHMVEGFGFMLNNMLGEDDLLEGGQWREVTRLSSMMAPTLIARADGSLAAFGTGGSARIRAAVLQVTVNLVDGGFDLAQAVAAPRLHVDQDGTVCLEPGLDGLAAAIEAAPKVRTWPEPDLFFGGVHAARRTADGAMEGAGDPRRGGVAITITKRKRS